MQTAFKNSTKVNEIKSDYISVLINKRQYDYQWFPSIQIGFQNSFNASRGDTLYLLNQASDSAITWTSTPSTYLSLNQKLPGKGYITLTTSYGFSYSIDHRLFLQWPQLQFSLSQKLSRGAFGITKNPEYQLVKEQLFYYTELYKQNLFNEIQNILDLIKRSDILDAEEQYYNSLLTEYESEMKTSKEKNRLGMQSNLETHYASHQYTEAQNYLNNLRSEKELLNQQLSLLIPEFNQKDLNIKRYELQNTLQVVYESLNKDSSGIEKNWNSILYYSVQRQYLYQHQDNETNFAPELFVTSSISPDGSFNAYYTDWFKSFRVLAERPYPLDFSVTMGIRKSFELPQAKKIRNEIYQMNKSLLEKDFLTLQETQKKEIDTLTRQIELDKSYLKNLEKEIETEQSFRLKRKEMLEKNIITQDDFYQSETIYFRIYRDYINTFWKLLNNQMSVMSICSDNITLLNLLTGENYDF